MAPTGLKPPEDAPLASSQENGLFTILLTEDLPTGAYDLGGYFMDGLDRIDSEDVEEIRGRGLLIGVKIQRTSGSARPYCEYLMALGILAKEAHPQVIRFAPLLVITKDKIGWALERIAKVLTG